ncbi:hypothetical protein [Accumulibacter sp.]|uniref:hypothetical protein n=1 Tax=Accumulibacter sp. TaxID=2053492 RepID=UPI0025EB07FB|nr:hypothetical protein [Accumulibacter sp.]
MSVTIGMLYKIVPFLVWSHLQNLGGGRVIAPNMNKVIAAGRINGQMYAHFVALALLLGAALWPPWFARPAGLALLTANAWLLYNLPRRDVLLPPPSAGDRGDDAERGEQPVKRPTDRGQR